MSHDSICQPASPHAQPIAVDVNPMKKVGEVVGSFDVNLTVTQQLDAMAEAMRNFAKFIEGTEEIEDLDYIVGCWCCDPTQAH